ncbi:hypothetical protein ACOMHN_035228 [Nucella lapillus]
MTSEFETIAPYIEPDTESSADEEPPTKRRRGESKVWVKCQEYQTVEDANDAISKDDWSILYTTKTLDGKKVYYKCRKGWNCRAEIFLLYKADDDGVDQYETGSHDHTGNTVPNRGIYPQTKSDIDSLYNDGVRESVFAPTHLVSDAATAIKNGFTAAFGHPPEKTIMCWAHVVMNMDKQLIRIKDKKTAAALREDITQLQLYPDEDAFYQATTLFLSKWESSNQAFLEYFRGSWIDQNNTWYEGYAPGCPSTNNGLEAVNQTIKRQNTFRERLQLSRFLNVVEQDILLNW